jgi:hypothetical protein
MISGFQTWHCTVVWHGAHGLHVLGAQHDEQHGTLCVSQWPEQTGTVTISFTGWQTV